MKKNLNSSQKTGILRLRNTKYDATSSSPIPRIHNLNENKEK